MHSYIKNNHIQAKKKIEKKILFQNGGQMVHFRFVSPFRLQQKFENLLSQRSFKIWLIIGDHEYINILKQKMHIF